MNVIEALEKIREGFKVKNNKYYDFKEFDYIAWSMKDGCVCGFKNGDICSLEISIRIDDLYEHCWEIVE